MLRPRTSITFEQQPSDLYPNRTGKITMPFVTECEMVESWRNLTVTASLTFPKNIHLVTQDGLIYDLASTRSSPGVRIIAGNQSPAPFLLRGDKITISAGYWDLENAGLRTLFTGYITSVKIKSPIEITCEDNMYLLKQVQLPNKLYAASLSMEDILTDMLNYINTKKGSSLSLHKAPEGINTNIGAFRTMNETMAQVLDRLQKDYKMNSFFRGNVLYSSLLAYYPAPDVEDKPVFVFQENIISDDLNYTRLDDCRIGAVVYSIKKEDAAGVNKNGHKKTATKRLQVTVGDTDGEMRTLYFWNAKSEDELKRLGQAQLKRFRYEGYRGTFVTFGEPYVNHGDQIILSDQILPERNGVYFVKSVTRATGVNGYRQTIELDLKVSGQDGVIISESEIQAGL